jgi:hypothetical protein
LHSCGITRENGLTAHGLRHAYAHDRYQELSGQDSPVRDGKLTNREDDRARARNSGKCAKRAKYRCL